MSTGECLCVCGGGREGGGGVENAKVSLPLRVSPRDRVSGTTSHACESRVALAAYSQSQLKVATCTPLFFFWGGRGL